MRCLFVLLLLSTQVWAQPWQWELFQGDYYNPTGFPNTSVRIGDFDGDGRGEILVGVGFQLLVFSKDSTSFHWSADTCAVPPGAIGSDAYDLDGDGADEIIVPGDPFLAWKAVSSNPWEWEARNDLVVGFEQQPWSITAVFGDFDQDGLLNGFFMDGWWQAPFYLTERMIDGTWVTDTTFDGGGGQSSGIYAGDFDHDGDRDIAIAPLFSDIPPFGGFGESTPQGIIWHVGIDWSLSDFPGPTGGDVDGDGQWEGLFLYRYNLGYSLVETAPGWNFVQTTESHYLGAPGGGVFGNFRVNGQSVVGAIHNWVWGDPGPANHSFECLMLSDSGWRGFNSGFHSGLQFSGYECMGGNRADLNGDGLEDIFTSLLDGGNTWGVWKNHGTAEQDSFSLLYLYNDFFTRRFLSNPDTVFSSPQIGDITGDGRAELAVNAVPPAGYHQVLFYEMIGEIEDTTFVLHPEWSTGLPIGFNHFNLADIDGDGISELLGYNGPWHAYFYRNGLWQEYADVLPQISANTISFADADNDGDLDLFAGNQLWYSLSPSSTEKGFIPHPSSFSLSAYPNPFNSELQIRYELPRAGHVDLAVYNVLGQQIAELVEGMQRAGSHQVTWSPSEGSGIYFVRMKSEEGIKTTKVLLAR
jgi:hypothetical protein